MVAYHARLVEVTSRLDFLWKQQAERELNDMEETRHNNTQLLKNILPDHVAQHFLSNERNGEVRFYIFIFSKLRHNLKCFRNYILSTGRKSVFYLEVFQILRTFIQKT